MTHIPLITLAGKTNVGKSTLFNRLSSDAKALVSPIRSTTRDANQGICSYNGKVFRVVDAAGLITGACSELDNKVNKQVMSCLADSDLIIFMLDAKSVPTEEDRVVAQLLRKSKKPVIAVVNKVDPGSDETPIYEYYSLGLDWLMPISAMHGTSIDELVEKISEKIELPDETEVEKDLVIRTGIVGKPNVGKTSLANTLAGDSLSIVDDTRGTTRDFLYRDLLLDEIRLLLIDTPGMSKGRKKSNLLDHLIYKRTRKLLGKINIALFVIDSTEKLTDGDIKIASMIKESRCGCIILLNKWDKAENKEELLKSWQDIFERKLQFLNWAPFLTVSARTGLRIESLKKLFKEIIKIYNLQINNDELNEAWKAQFGSRLFSYHKRNIRFFGITFSCGMPVVFTVKTNYPNLIHFSLKRSIENWLRDRYGIIGVPINLRFRK